MNSVTYRRLGVAFVDTGCRSCDEMWSMVPKMLQAFHISNYLHIQVTIDQASSGTYQDAKIRPKWGVSKNACSASINVETHSVIYSISRRTLKDEHAQNTRLTRAAAKLSG